MLDEPIWLSREPSVISMQLWFTRAAPDLDIPIKARPTWTSWYVDFALSGVYSRPLSGAWLGRRVVGNGRTRIMDNARVLTS